MFDRIRGEGFPEGNAEDLRRRLEENLGMQQDCEIEIDRCREAGEQENLEKTKATLDSLKADEASIREQLGS